MILKSKLFKAVCASAVLVATTIGLIVPKAAESYPQLKNDTALAADAQTSDPIIMDIRPIQPNNGGTLDFSAKPGEKFKLAVDIWNIPDASINCGEFAVKFDPDVVTINSVEKGDALPELTDDDFYIGKNKINFMFALPDSSISDNGTLLEINGTVKSSASKGDKAEFQVVPITDNILMAYLNENDKFTTYNVEENSVITVLEVSEDIVTTAPVTTAPPVTTTAPVTTTVKPLTSLKPVTKVPTISTMPPMSCVTSIKYVTSVKPVTATLVTTVKFPIITSEIPATATNVPTTTTKAPVTTIIKIPLLTSQIPVTTAKVPTTTTTPVTTELVIGTLPYWPTEPTDPHYTVPIGSGNNGCIVGDIYIDGKVNVADLVLLKKYIVNKGPEPFVVTVVQSGSQLGGYQYVSDTNGDGYTDVFDVVALRRYLLK